MPLHLPDKKSREGKNGGGVFKLIEISTMEN